MPAHDPPPNYSNWPLNFLATFFLFLVVTLLNNDRLLVVTVH